MKKNIFVISIFFNTCFFVLFGYMIYQRGGFSYLKSKLSKSVKETSVHRPYWYYKTNKDWKEILSLYRVLPNDSNEIIFLGNSLTFGCEWAELLNNPAVKNRGIGGDNTEGILERLDEITESKPKKIFINVGTNDLDFKMKISEIHQNYVKIINNIKTSSPNTKIYIQSVLPTNNHVRRNNDSIIVLNKKLNEFALQNSIVYINLFDSFLDNKHRLDMKYSFDGLHLNGEGYLVWKKLVESYVEE